jgi:uncharacterized Zn-finger protein
MHFQKILPQKSAFGLKDLGIGPVRRYGPAEFYHPSTRSAVSEKGDPIMADHVIPHFHNDAGVGVIEVGAKEFMCVGALPPFDHPHIFLDMGGDNEIICSYCSTLYRFDPTLAPNAARPPECALPDTENA